MQGQMPAEMAAELALYQGAGVSERSQDFQVPFFMIAQANSPQLKKQMPDKFIPGLAAGDIFNTSTGEFWPGAECIQVIQAFFQKAMVEWILRDEGGGWVATHDIDTPYLKRCKWGGERDRFLLTPDGHQMVDTSYHFVATPADGDVGVVSMTSTSLGCSRQWQTLMKRVKVPHNGTLVVAPSFARIYQLKTAWKKNDQGDWYVWTVSDAGWAAGNPAARPGYEAAKKFFEHARDHGVVMGRPPVDSDSGGDTIDASAEPPI
jgi:hypothetical protein